MQIYIVEFCKKMPTIARESTKVDESARESTRVDESARESTRVGDEMTRALGRAISVNTSRFVS
jgi:hypothetical protein